MQTEYDYTASGVFPLQHQRTYNSSLGGWSVFPTLEVVGESEELPGNGSIYCSKDVDPVTNSVTFNGCFEGFGVVIGKIIVLSFTRPDGRVINATFSADDIGAPNINAFPSISTNVRENIRAVFDASDNHVGWELVLTDDTVEFYDPAGVLLSRTHRTGLVHNYTYDSSGVLQSISDTFGKTLTYVFNGDGLVTSLTDPDGNTYTYGYDAENRLASISYPDDTPGNASDNPTRQFHYEDADHLNALTGITDERGVRFATWAYDIDGRATLSEHSGGAERLEIDFVNLSDPIDPRITTTNALGIETTYHVNNPAGISRVAHIEGHASTNCAAASSFQTFDGRGNVASRTDSNGTVTEFEYNDRHLETLRREAVGTAQERTFATEWHDTLRLPIKITEPDRIIEFTYDDQGNVVTRTERGTP